MQANSSVWMLQIEFDVLGVFAFQQLASSNPFPLD